MEKIKTYSLSFQGRRENNQDSCIVFNLDINSLFIAVADGMGGVAGGEKASKAVIECCKRILIEKFKEGKTPDLKQVLRKIFFEAQRTITQEIKLHPELSGMGTTLACVLILQDKFVWGNLGDSRVYYFTESKLRTITKDHTHIQEFIDKNDQQLTQSMIEKYSNFLTRSIDGGTDEPDIYPEGSEFSELKDGEAFLICSDGLINNKAKDNSRQLGNIILGTKDLEQAAKKLVDTAFAEGSTDNITVVLLEKGKIKRQKIAPNIPASLPKAKLLSKRKSKNIWAKITGTLSLMIFIAIIFIVWGKPYLFKQSVTSGTPQNKTLHDDQSKKPNPEKIKSSEFQTDKDTAAITEKENSANEINEEKKSAKDSTDLEDKMIEVPSLIDKTLDQAKEELKDIGLVFTVHPEGNKKSKIGLITRQIPEQGNKVNKGYKITLFVGI